MEDALANQQTIFHSIARALDNFKKIGRSNLTAARVRSRIATLQAQWTQGVHNHTILLQLVPEDDQGSINYFKKNQFDLHEDLYQSALDHMNECLEDLVPVVSRDTSLETSFAQMDASSFSLKHLPPIKLPPFSGKNEDWETFRDRFQSLIIDNKELSNFTRMHFLISSLTGPARDAISGIKVTAENFKVAWKALTTRFENKRRLIEVHVSTLYHLPKMTRESASELHELRDKTEQALATLKRLDRTAEDIVSDILVYFISQKFDSATRRAWKLKSSDNENPPTYKDLIRFISSRAIALEELHPHEHDKTKSHSRVTSATATASVNLSCPICKQSHFLSKCQQFLSMSTDQRRELIKKLKRCFNCLSDKHVALNCQSKFTCRKCSKRHHTMIHVDSGSLQQTTSIPASSSSQNVTNISNVTALSAVTLTTSPTPVVLSTATVKIHSLSGRSLTVRALLDGGSELTFLTERVAQILRLPRMQTFTSTSGISCADTGTCRSAALINISPRDKPEPTFTTVAYIMRALTKYAPRHASSLRDWKHISNLTLADDDPTGSTPIDLIIGADLYSKVLVNIRNGPIGQPDAIQSHFGWILSGPTSIPNHVIQNTHVVGSTLVSSHVGAQPQGSPLPSSQQRYHAVAHCCSLERQLCKFWEVEETPQHVHASIEDKQCEDHFQRTHTRTADGRYVVRLPFKEGPPIKIGDSRSIAERRLSSLIRKFARQPTLAQEYLDFMREYEQLNHMKQVAPLHSNNVQATYIPHHPVIKETSSTTRLRVVFDASCLTSNGTSLNFHMYTGPKLQSDLQAVILRWRQYKYVYSADIAKMYRQILIDPRDRDYQRILWVDHNSTIQEYQLLTVTYGTASAPFLALRVIQQLNCDEGDSFPLASPILRENIYVDDVLFGADDITLLKQARTQLCNLLNRGGFDLRKWASNHSELLSDIQPDNHGLAYAKNLETDDSLKILGIVWNPKHDCFQFQITLSETVPNTKRAILSTIARLFDPLGWVTPAILKAKTLMQQLWRHRIGWDDIIPDEILSSWKSIYESLPYLRKIQLSRWTGFESGTATVELHGFADASTIAYAAVVFLRVTSSSGKITVSLIAGRSKVASLKPMTVPRLELSAAVLLVRLIDFIKQSLHLSDIAIYCWTDSTVVLAWLKKHPSNWKTFVAHRVAEIQTRLPTGSWHHVNTSENPADCASRGLLGRDLISINLWWHGPSWLHLHSDEWPHQILSEHHETQLELKACEAHQNSTREDWSLAARYSWWPKLIRVTAYIYRFINKCQRKHAADHKDHVRSHAITAFEYMQSRNFWLHMIQAEVFKQELYLLKSNKRLSRNSALISLNPFLDANGLLRVGGRLEHSHLPFQSKHPVLLADHPITTMLIRYTHIASLHAGLQSTLSKIRQEFWIIKSRPLVKSVIYRCVRCTRERAQVANQLMGQLPSTRVSTPTRAFLHSGIDYAGPVLIRASAGRGITSRKAYIAVFICLATRAIHLELVSDYSTPAFLNAFQRFCARRGLPAVMYSDNGTTFTGADKELSRAYRDAQRNTDFLNLIATDRITWSFIPPHAPHFGGLWEAGVKSVKHHLRRIVSSHALTFEEFTTVLCKIEAILNSRPLSPLNDTPDDYEFLTPGHLLIGTAITTNPEPSVLQLNENRLSRWQLLRQITERFWKQWQSDYVNTLQQRSKWRRETPPIQVGSMVLIQNPLLPPCKWELGRVIHCHPGSDGLTRVVSVKTATSEYKRPVTKLCLLPIDINLIDQLSERKTGTAENPTP